MRLAERSFALRGGVAGRPRRGGERLGGRLGGHGAGGAGGASHKSIGGGLLDGFGRDG